MSYGSPDQPTYSSPPPQKSNAIWWVLGILAFLGIGGAIACCGGLGLIAYVGTQAINGVVQQAMASDPNVQEHIGTITTLSMNISATGEAGGGNILVFDIVGDKGSGQLEVTTKNGNGQDISSAVLVLPNGDRHDVILTPPQNSSTSEFELELETAESPETDPGMLDDLAVPAEPADTAEAAAEPALQ